jgi:hypothetical protein
MRIERNDPTAVANNAIKPIKPTTAQASESSSFENSHRLNQVLATTVPARADQVARAKALIADPNYPSEQQMGKIANLLAKHLSSTETTA